MKKIVYILAFLLGTLVIGVVDGLLGTSAALEKVGSIPVIIHIFMYIVLGAALIKLLEHLEQNRKRNKIKKEIEERIAELQEEIYGYAAPGLNLLPDNQKKMELLMTRIQELHWVLGIRKEYTDINL